MEITRTQDEIVARIEERKGNDFLGWERSDYVAYLDFPLVKPFLKEGTTPEQWRVNTTDPRENILDYMEFAWDKANSERGISANRSISHCMAWLWLAGEDALLEKVEHEYNTNYCYYGKPILEMICDHFGWDWKVWDDGDRSNG